jgi:hypothetical protein
MFEPVEGLYGSLVDRPAGDRLSPIHDRDAGVIEWKVRYRPEGSTVARKMLYVSTASPPQIPVNLSLVVALQSNARHATYVLLSTRSLSDPS